MTRANIPLPALGSLAPINGQHYKIGGLSPEERALLSTDGNFTILLESLRNAAINIRVLNTDLEPATPEIQSLFGTSLPDGVWHRDVLLEQANGEEPLVYASSLIDPSHFSSQDQNRLRESTIGLGRLLAERPDTTGRDLLGFRMETGGAHLKHFDLPPAAQSLTRTYRITTKTATIAFVTETWPRELFSGQSISMAPDGPDDTALTKFGKHTAILGLGSNQGSRIEALVEAVRQLQARGIRIDSCSSVYETAPVGMSSSNAFANAAIKISFEGSFRYLLTLIHDVEQATGRARSEKWTDRLIDIDILFAGETVLNTSLLIIPHPLATTRGFVLVPVLELEPEIIDPHTGAPLASALANTYPLPNYLTLLGKDAFHAQLLRDDV